MNEVLNAQLNPELKRLELGSIALTYTDHALLRANEKGIKTPIRLVLGPGSIVELERTQTRTTKLVARIRHDMSNDMVLVLKPVQPGCFIVITMWLNNVADNHATLKKDRLKLKSA